MKAARGKAFIIRSKSNPAVRMWCIRARHERPRQAEIAAFIGQYNRRHYHESLNNLTPVEAYLGRGQTILMERERIKR